jgi:pimeloyl-ACP methyl ester carboxylesterase
MSHLVQDLVSLVATLVSKESKLYLVGHDWGGAVSWGTLVAHPAMFDKAGAFSLKRPGCTFCLSARM